jgi:hypothetical protein
MIPGRKSAAGNLAASRTEKEDYKRKRTDVFEEPTTFASNSKLGLPTSNCLRKSASWDLSQITEYLRQVTGSKKEPEFCYWQADRREQGRIESDWRVDIPPDILDAGPAKREDIKVRLELMRRSDAA